MKPSYTHRQKRYLATLLRIRRRRKKKTLKVAAAMEVFIPVSSGFCIICNLIETDPLYCMSNFEVSNTNKKDA